MRRTAAAFAVTASALLLAACGSSGNSSSAPSAQTSAPSSAAPAATTQNAAAPSQSAAATSLDPCQLVTSSEASSLAGTTYGSGQEETDNGGKRCVYGSGTTNVFTVEVAQAQDSATAQADWAQDQSEAQAAVEQKLPSGVNVTLDTQNVTGLADRAATATGSTSIDGQAVGFSGIYLLKGATFLAFQDVQLGSAAPTASAMQTEAATALARVP